MRKCAHVKRAAVNMKFYAEPPEPRRGAVFDTIDFQIARQLENGFESIPKEYCDLDAPSLSIHRNADIRAKRAKNKGRRKRLDSFVASRQHCSQPFVATYGLSYKGFSPLDVTANLQHSDRF